MMEMYANFGWRGWAFEHLAPRQGAQKARSDRTRNLLCIIFLLCSAVAYAQPMKPPHDTGSVATGVIAGTLLKDGKTPLVGHTVTLEILSGHNLILTLPKETDVKGAYLFKNIFQSPEFSYAISTSFESKTYRTDFISLKKGEKTHKLNLMVGAGVSEGPSLPPPIDDEKDIQRTGGEHTHMHKRALNEYQMLAIILAVAAVGYAVYQRKKTK